LEQLAQRLREQHGVAATVLAADLTDSEELIRLQVLAVTRLTRAALPGMIARGRGAIINVSSLLAFSASLPSPPLPARATYAATKSYINTFTEILHSSCREPAFARKRSAQELCAPSFSSWWALTPTGCR
jgi:short-subunit dehydrogenase